MLLNNNHIGSWYWVCSFDFKNTYEVTFRAIYYKYRGKRIIRIELEIFLWENRDTGNQITEMNLDRKTIL